MSTAKRILPVLVIALTLGGCGFFVPHPHEFYEGKSNDIEFTNVILNDIKCELHKEAQQIVTRPPQPPNPQLDWLKQWGAKVDLKFTTDEIGTINPGAAFKPPPPFSLGIGVSGSTHATRVEDLVVTYAFADLLAEPDIPSTGCANEGGVFIQSDLDIGDFLYKHVSLATIPGTLPAGKNVLYSTLTYTVSFVTSYDGNITPTWTFKRVTVDPSGKLLDLSRTKTSNLIITFSGTNGAAPSPNTPAMLNEEGLLAHDAAVIGNAVGTANQTLTH